mmetsp:Transcript_11395/g.17175  ORF Transcript_11395/g.17175 Transcript_11395/m.17175 type:complete len:201 (-) Transcript_11395:68-670(-)
MAMPHDLHAKCRTNSNVSSQLLQSVPGQGQRGRCDGRRSRGSIHGRHQLCHLCQAMVGIVPTCTFSLGFHMSGGDSKRGMLPTALLRGGIERPKFGHNSCSFLHEVAVQPYLAGRGRRRLLCGLGPQIARGNCSSNSSNSSSSSSSRGLDTLDGSGEVLGCGGLVGSQVWGNSEGQPIRDCGRTHDSQKKVLHCNRGLVC